MKNKKSSYICHGLPEYTLAMELREKYGWGNKRIAYKLSELGFNVNVGTVAGWIYFGKKPFLDRLITKIPLTSYDLNLEKAYILGTLCGDGYITTNYRVGLNVCDLDFIQYFQFCIEKVYGIKVPLLKKELRPTNFCSNPKQQYQIFLRSKLVVEDLLRYALSYKTFEWMVPQEIKFSSREIQASFIKGFADSEGSVKNRHRNREVTLCSGNIQGLDDIRKMLRETFGINSYYNHRKNNVFVIALGDYRSLDIFRNEIGFIIKRKQEKLEMGLAYYKRKGIYKYSFETKQKALEMIQEGKTHVEIGRILGTSYANIHDWEKAAKDPEYYRKRYQKWKVQQKI